MPASQNGKLPGRPPEFADEPPQPYWPTFIEKLLLALVDAHPPLPDRGVPTMDAARQERLEKALSALLGVPPTRGPRWSYDLPAMVRFGRHKLVDEAAATLAEQLRYDWEEPVPSDREASAPKISRTQGNSQPSAADRIRRKTRDKQTGAYLAQIANLNYHAEEEAMMEDLQAIAAILARWNVSLRLDPVALGMASLWGAELPK